jgi:inner membrane protein
MMAFPWWAWAILAAIVGLAELHVPGSYLVWVALGAALTAGAVALWGLTLEGQLGLFAVASAFACVAGYFVYRAILHAPSKEEAPLNQRNEMMRGAQGVVCERFANGHGKVRLGDGVWLAHGPDALAEGTPVTVTAVRGTSVIVERS